MIDSSVMNRPSLALANALYGDVGASGRALLDPYSLSAKESKDLIDRMELDDGPFSAILKTVTNPFVLIGTIMAMRYPVPLLKNLNVFSSKVTKAASRYGVLSRLKGFSNIYKDRPEILSAFGDALAGAHKYKEKYLLKAYEAVTDYERVSGKVFGPRQQFILQSKMKKLDEYTKYGKKKLWSPLNKSAIDTEYDTHLHGLNKKFRAIYDESYMELLESPEHRGILESVLGEKERAKFLKSYKSKGLEGKEISFKDIWSKLPSDERQRLQGKGILGIYEKDYLPDILARDMMTKDEWKSINVALTGTEGNFAQKQMAAIKDPLPGSVRAKKYHLLPDPRDLERFPDLVDQKGLQKLKDLMGYDHFMQTGQYQQGAKIRGPLVGSPGFEREVLPLARMRFYETYETYANGMANLSGWTLNGAGKKLTAAVQAMKVSDPGRAKLLQDVYIPIARGKLTQRQMMAAQQWGATKARVYDSLKESWVKDLIPDSAQKWIKDALLSDRGPFSLIGTSGGAAGWLYLGTLGMNAGSASLNLLQNALTTVPLIGATATMQGMGRVFSRSRKYFNLRGAKKSHEKALELAFPEFAEAGLSHSPVIDEALSSAFKYSWDEGVLKLPNRFSKGFDRTKRAMMSMFTATESFNRLVAFEGALWKGAREGWKKGSSELLVAAKDVVAKTQFLAGPENIPSILVDKNPLLRQYMTFPTKMLEFVTDTAMSVGSGAQAGFMGKNWGTLGRAMAASGVLYEGGRSLGMDFSEGLLTGSLPVPRAGRPFSPIPLVPPALSLAGAGVEAIMGDPKNLKYALPMLVPGGLAASRAMPFIPGMGESAGKTLGRRYADYNSPTPDGKYPVYSSKGSLIGYFNRKQILAEASGITGRNNFSTEAEYVQWGIKNRDRIREYRRNYVDALAKNNEKEARSIKKEYENAYQVPLILKESDIRAMQMRRDVPRLEKLLSTLPKELRPQFAAMIQTALLAQGNQFLGIDPALLGTKTPIQMMPYRASRPSGYQRKGQYQHRMGPLGGFNQDTISRSELPETGAGTGLGAFGSGSFNPYGTMHK